MKGKIETRRLGDLFTFKNGRAFKKEEWSISGLPIVRIQNLNREDAPFNYFAGDYNDDILVESGDLLFSWSGTVGSSFGSHLWNGETGVLNQHIFKVGLRDLITKRYAFHALRHITVEIEQSVSGAVGLVHITKEKLNEFTLPVPPVSEQQRIVGILDEAFEGIATAKANAERNLRKARAIFESYLQSVFTRRSEGWVDAKLGDVCDKITDGTHRTPTYTKEGVPFLSVKNLTQGFIDFSDTRFISVAEHESLTRRCKPVRDDILYTKVGTTGVAQVVDVDDDFSIFVSVALLKPKHEIVFNLYLEHFLNAPYAREQAQKRTRGMANKNLVISDIREIDVHFPRALDEQRRIVAKLESLSAETQRLTSVYQQKLAALEALKTSLLREAFAGKL